MLETKVGGWNARSKTRRWSTPSNLVFSRTEKQESWKVVTSAGGGCKHLPGLPDFSWAGWHATGCTPGGKAPNHRLLFTSARWPGTQPPRFIRRLGLGTRWQGSPTNNPTSSVTQHLPTGGHPSWHPSFPPIRRPPSLTTLTGNIGWHSVLHTLFLAIQPRRCAKSSFLDEFSSGSIWCQFTLNICCS